MTNEKQVDERILLRDALIDAGLQSQDAFAVAVDWGINAINAETPVEALINEYDIPEEFAKKALDVIKRWEVI